MEEKKPEQENGGHISGLLAVSASPSVSMASWTFVTPAGETAILI